MPYNKGDFTQQGINGDVSALVRLNEKRVMKVVLSSDDESDNCDISGKVYDLLNGTSYDIGSGGGGGGDYPAYGPETTLFGSYTAKINLNNDTTYSSWTPSNTAGNITNAVPNAIHEALPDDYKEYVYFVKIYQTTSIIIKENATLDKIPKTWTLGIVMELFYKPNTPSDWSAGTLNTLDNQGFSVKELGYYNNGTLQSVTNGFYGPMYADNFNANVSQENGVYYFIVNMPAVRARCNDNYFATTQASNIEDADFEITIEVYKTPRNNSPVGDLLNDMIADYPVIPA